MDKMRIMKPRSGYLHGIAEGLLLASKFDLADAEIDESLTPESLGVEKEWTRKVKRGLIVEINGKHILIDQNNTENFTRLLIDNGDIAKFNLALKLQCKNPHLWNCPIPITHWTFGEMEQGTAVKYRDQYQHSEKKFRCGFVGRTYPFRINFHKELEGLEDTDVEYWQRREHKKRRMELDDYFKRMCTWESALVLRGTCSDRLDGKTWREVECAAMGIPMILDVGAGAPTYYVPLEPWKHYVPVEEVEDLEEALNLAKPDMGQRAIQWYEEAASPEGMCKSFFKLIEEFGII